MAIVGRTLEKLEAVQREIEARRHLLGARRRHPRRGARCRRRSRRCSRAHGRIDALVNNAGGQFPSPLATISAKGWDAVVRNNLTGGFLMARECINQWMLEDDGTGAARGGAIVNIIADMWNGMPGMGHSGAARAGMLNFTETAALEWAPVRVNAVAPGWIASSGLDHYPPEMAEHFRGMHALVPLRRLGTESEVAAAIVFLLSPAAAFVSGAACASTARRRTRSGSGPRSAPAARPSRSTASISPRRPTCSKKAS